MNRKSVSTLGLTLPLALILAWISNGFRNLDGWGSFIGALILAAALLGGGLFLLRGELYSQEGKREDWVIGLTILAAIIRLAAGVLWFTLLPEYGYDNTVNNAGYVMEDAYRRDSAAWELSESGEPLWIAFRETEFGNFRDVDQYGGMLFINASVYRSLGGASHNPLLMVVLTAAVSALAIPFCWAFLKRLFGPKPATWAAWGLALYPEAVLLGSSQMREAFVMAFAAIALYGLVVHRNRGKTGISPYRSRPIGLTWMIAALLLTLLLSPPYAAILVGILALIGLALDDWQFIRSWQLWAIFAGLIFLVGVSLWFGWEQIAPRLSNRNFENPIAMVQYWFELSARWQARQTTEASGWIQKITDSTPEWFNLPFLIGYGVTRPLLPAQLTAWSVPIWWGIGVWRALGWTLLLPLLLYAPVQALRLSEKRNLALGLSLAVWISILAAAFWGGGDQWDNPRYRVAFSALQWGLAAHVIAAQLKAPDPWMKRVMVGFLAILAWFLPWYLRRYTTFDQIFGWAVVDVFKVLGLGLSTGVLYILWDWAGSARLE